jgi:hypothetical protein
LEGKALRASSCGVVVLSPSFFTKNWPQAELDALFAIEMSGKKVILPVRHGLTHQQLVSLSPTLAGLLAADSAKGIQAVAIEIRDVVRGTRNESPAAPTTG